MGKNGFPVNNRNFEINVHLFPAGIYSVKAANGNEMFNARFIVF